jgi:hypothetical protein
MYSNGHFKSNLVNGPKRYYNDEENSVTSDAATLNNHLADGGKSPRLKTPKEEFTLTPGGVASNQGGN